MASEPDGPPRPSALSGLSPTSAAGPASASPIRHRVPLRHNRRRLSYELRLRLWLFACTLPAVALAAGIAWYLTQSLSLAGSVAAVAALVAVYLTRVLFEHITRPLQTLTNVVSALRDDDFSFRARGARRGDSLGDLALEINSLANALQAQRSVTRDALTLAERVMEAMRTPVLAFTPEGTLRLLNPAAESAFLLKRPLALGHSADALGLAALLQRTDGSIYAQPAVSGVAGEVRWSLRRSTFRLGGIPHHLFVLSDVQNALREEERLAWQRLIRVLSHEINNSLTPITSIAGSLSARIAANATGSTRPPAELLAEDLRRGLQLIQERAFSLHHFLQAYQQLTRLPPPTFQRVALPPLLQRLGALEIRVAVEVLDGPALEVSLDPAQIEQLLINLLRNAAEAALSLTAAGHLPRVTLGWKATSTDLVIHVQDNGPGLADTANLFVPFYTTKPEGTGVGLALAKQIASAHGGTLTLANRQDGPGCLAELRLPLTPSP